MNVFVSWLFFFVFFLFSACTPEETPDGPVYLSEVIEYVYGPGQHAKLALPTDTGFITGNPQLHDGWLYLGGWGGYVVAAFPRDVLNEEGADLEIFAMPGAAPEPAVVFVMSDDNGNNRPDEKWYELKGSLYDESLRNYTLTYFKPSSETGNIRWEDSEGATGELRSYFGSTNSAGWWWPSNVDSESVTFTGTLLPAIYENSSSDEGPGYWAVPEGRLGWGYAENNSGSDYDVSRHSNHLDISNAIDEDGKHVQLSAIRFLKIQSAVLQQAGQTNEVSPEIRGARSLR